MNPLISVIIPTFNRKHIVYEAIKSVLIQEPKNYEVIIVDDGSTDGTVEYLSSLNLPMKIIRQKNKGVASARNKGINNAVGQYIAFLDSDDIWLPGILKTQLEYLESHPNIPLAYVDQYIEIQHRRIEITRFTMSQFSHEEMSQFSIPTFARSHPIHISSIIARASIFKEVGYFNEELKLHEDIDMWNRICEKYDVGYIKKPLVIFRREIDQQHLNKPANRKKFISEGKKYIDVFKKRKNGIVLTPEELKAIDICLARIKKLEELMESQLRGEITEQKFYKKQQELAWEK